MSDICIPITQQFHPREVCLHIGKGKGKKKKKPENIYKIFHKSIIPQKTNSGKNQVIFKIIDRE